MSPLRTRVVLVASSLLLVSLLPAPGRVPPAPSGLLSEAIPTSREASPPEAAPPAAASPEPVAVAVERSEPLAEPDPAPVPLDRLLQVPAGLALDDPLSGAGRFARPPVDVAQRPPPSGPWQHLRIERRSEQLSAAPRIGTLEQAEIGVAVPLEDSVRLRGGVRLDRQRTDEGPQEWENPTPSVGLEWTV